MIQLVNKNASKRTPAGLKQCVEKIGCELEAVEAVIAVEAAGRGWDSQGRLRMLFEPHVFYRVLAKDPDALHRAIVAGLAYPRWGERKYPEDSYPRLNSACQINEEYALRAASWGLPQILGENFKAAGYNSATDMVTSFLAGEDEQLTALATFVVANKLDGALRAKQWAAFARGYNGAGYTKNSYDTLLQTAYTKAKRRTALGKAATATATVSTVGAPVGGAGTAATRADGPETGVVVIGLLVVGAVAWAFSKWNASRSIVVKAPAPEPKASVEPRADEALTNLLSAQAEVADLRAQLKAANDRLVAARSAMHERIETMRQAYVASGGELGAALNELRDVVEGLS